MHWVLFAVLVLLTCALNVTVCWPAGDALAVLPVRCLQAQLRQDPLAFCTSCCTMAKKLGLQLPRVAGEALLLRSVKELGLPQVCIFVHMHTQ